MPPLTQSTTRALLESLGPERVERDHLLAPYTTFKIDGSADLLYRARTPDELAQAVGTARELELPFFLLGMGANILTGNRGFPGLVIKNEVDGIEFLDEGRVRAGSGVLVYHDLIQATVERDLGGMHHLVGIPSTVGGAIWQNLHFLTTAGTSSSASPSG
jgi:UDP-N-acetylmuramate dehydrogenase